MSTIDPLTRELPRDRPAQGVLGLAERLRTDGVDAEIDQYVAGAPEEGWPRWMLNRLDWADFVLVVCTETYYRRFRGHELPGAGKGSDWKEISSHLGFTIRKVERRNLSPFSLNPGTKHSFRNH